MNLSINIEYTIRNLVFNIRTDVHNSKNRINRMDVQRFTYIPVLDSVGSISTNDFNLNTK